MGLFSGKRGKEGTKWKAIHLEDTRHGLGKRETARFDYRGCSKKNFREVRRYLANFRYFTALAYLPTSS